MTENSLSTWDESCLSAFQWQVNVLSTLNLGHGLGYAMHRPSSSIEWPFSMPGPGSAPDSKPYSQSPRHLKPLSGSDLSSSSLERCCDRTLLLQSSGILTVTWELVTVSTSGKGSLWIIIPPPSLIPLSFPLSCYFHLLKMALSNRTFWNVEEGFSLCAVQRSSH